MNSSFFVGSNCFLGCTVCILKYMRVAHLCCCGYCEARGNYQFGELNLSLTSIQNSTSHENWTFSRGECAKSVVIWHHLGDGTARGVQLSRFERSLLMHLDQRHQGRFVMPVSQESSQAFDSSRVGLCEWCFRLVAELWQYGSRGMHHPLPLQAAASSPAGLLSTQEAQSGSTPLIVFDETKKESHRPVSGFKKLYRRLRASHKVAAYVHGVKRPAPAILPNFRRVQEPRSDFSFIT